MILVETKITSQMWKSITAVHPVMNIQNLLTSIRQNSDIGGRKSVERK
jgi:hypothetical protein